MRCFPSGVTGPRFNWMPELHAIIAGSGFGEAFAGETLDTAVTRFGRPSSALRRLKIAGEPVLVLARHGDAHTIPPHRINYRANLLALHEAGAGAVIALCTVGVVSSICAPGGIAVPEQLIDYTWGREHTVFDDIEGASGHVDFTAPFCPELRAALTRAAGCRAGGICAVTQGPRLETAAEVDRLQRDGADFVGMTAMPEAAIARELNIRYACIALAVNHAAGRGDAPIHNDVTRHTEAARSAAMSALRNYFGACHNAS